MSICKYKEGMSMNIGLVSMALAQSNSLSDVGTAVLSKTLDNAEQNGNGILKMMDSAALERSVNPGIGSNFDMVI